jgi:hypothetical protein
MIFYKPITEKENIKEIYSNISFDDNLLYGAYIGFEEDLSVVGKCLVKIDKYNCYVLSVECDYNDKLLVEGFLRSGLNYCANRNAYMCYCEIEEISDVLKHLGFEYKNGVYSGDIPTLLKGSCCK